MTETYPRVLDQTGCLYGQSTREQLSELRKCVNGMEKKIDKLTWALVGTAITFGTAAVMLALNLVV